MDYTAKNKFSEETLRNVDLLKREISNIANYVNMRQSKAFLYYIAYVCCIVSRKYGRDSVTAEKLFEFMKASTFGAAVMFKNSFDNETIKLLERLAKTFSQDTFEAYIMLDIPYCGYSIVDADGFFGSGPTPIFVAKLARRVLDIRDGDVVADICSGRGTLISECSVIGELTLHEYEININMVIILMIKNEIFGRNSKVISGDIALTLNEGGEQYMKIFADYPFMQRLNTLKHVQFDDILDEFLRLTTKRVHANWIYNLLVCKHLSDDGRAVVVMPAGAMFNMLDKKAREYFVERGLIEAIISLPKNTYAPYTGIDTVLVIFSKGNSSIKFIDGSNLKIEDDSVEKIIRMDHYGECLIVSHNDIQKGDYSLDIHTYDFEMPLFENGEKLSEIVDVFRSNVSNKTDESSGVLDDEFIVRLTDLSDGIIADELSPLPKKALEKHIEYLRPGDILISRSGNPLKVAIVEEEEYRKLVPSENIYVLRNRGTYLNPYYLLAFFMSEKGKVVLERTATGSNIIRTISIKGLGNMVVPIPDNKKQGMIALRMKEAITELRMHKYKINDIRKGIENHFGEGF